MSNDNGQLQNATDRIVELVQTLNNAFSTYEGEASRRSKSLRWLTADERISRLENALAETKALVSDRNLVTFPYRDFLRHTAETIQSEIWKLRESRLRPLREKLATMRAQSARPSSM